MTAHSFTLHQATVSADTLSRALAQNAQGQAYDWQASYPVLAELDTMKLHRSATIFPDDCPNLACDAYALGQLKMPIDSGLAIMEAANHGISAALDDLRLKQPNQWFKLTPVHWQAGRDQVHLKALDADGVHISEAKQLLDTIAPWLKEWGWHIHVVAPTQWFVRVNSPFDYLAPSLTMASSDQLEHFLPKGRDLARWQTLLTEIQMAWFNHPVNQAREAKKRLPINSVWLDNSSTAYIWTPVRMTQWRAVQERITTFSGTDIHEHLQALNTLLEPAIETLKKDKEASITLLGDTWQQDLILEKPSFKGIFKKHNNKPLNWLETPQFDFLKG